MSESIQQLMAFTLFFWSRREREGSREYFMLDLVGRCCQGGCGGKFQSLVAVGYREGEEYFLKSLSALLENGEFPFPASLTCTNCGVTITLPDKEANTVSAAAETFITGLRETRRIAKAPLN